MCETCGYRGNCAEDSCPVRGAIPPPSGANPYLDVFNAAAAHQREHGGLMLDGQPWEMCVKCLVQGGDAAVYRGHHAAKRTYSWAVPNDEALAAIAEHSPAGVVEIGAGGGYWARLLRARGVDVIAYDPDPVVGYPHLGGARPGEDPGTRWSNVSWTEVLVADHHAAAHHPDRTLLLVWPSYDEPWTDQVLDLYAGDTVIYVGEGAGGCTGTGRMHTLLGQEEYCWHGELDVPCTCATGDDARFEEILDVGIPQWAGLHDRLGVYRRVRRSTCVTTAVDLPMGPARPRELR